MHCKYCKEQILLVDNLHDCKKIGLLDINKDDSFLVSAIIGAVTDSTLLGGLLGGDFIGGILGDITDGDLLD